MSSFQTYSDEDVTEVELMQAQERYSKERAKRLRDDGLEQFVDISLTEKFQHFQEDPWANADTMKDIRDMFPNSRCQMLIIGGGFGGLLNAVRMIESGVHPEDIRIIDTAGGFGGTVGRSFLIPSLRNRLLSYLSALKTVSTKDSAPDRPNIRY